jgi:hypothetical protein
MEKKYLKAVPVLVRQIREVYVPALGISGSPELERVFKTSLDALEEIIARLRPAAPAPKLLPPPKPGKDF